MSHLSLRRSAALLSVLGGLLAVPAPAALAAGATVTGDAGQPVPLSGAVSIRHMRPDLAFQFAPDEQRYAVEVLGPQGQPAAVGISCVRTTNAFTQRVKYLGNGTYTLVLRVTRNADDTTCSQATEQRLPFEINARTSVGQPGGAATLLTRRQNEFAVINHEVPVELNPGADSYELRYAPGAVLSPDGSISGPSEQAFVNTDTGKASVGFTRPGRYTFVVRAKSFSSDVATAWSAPVTVTVLAPFDFFNLSLADARGPTYRITGQLRESTAAGKVTIAMGKGTRPRRYRTLGTARLRSGAKFSFRFRHRRTGTYTLRFSFKGSETVAAGSVKRAIRFTRSSAF